MPFNTTRAIFFGDVNFILGSPTCVALRLNLKSFFQLDYDLDIKVDV